MVDEHVFCRTCLHVLLLSLPPSQTHINMLSYYIVDAFTGKPFGGNTAGVVLTETGQLFPEDETMRLIAAEFRYSETAFVKAETDGSFTTRYFTPTGEVPLCGHATVATFGVLFRNGLLHEGQCYLNHTLAGDLKVVAGPTTMMQMAEPKLIATLSDTERNRLYSIMGLTGTTNLPVQIVSTGLPDIMLPVASIEALQNLHPDMKALSELSEKLQVVGVHAFALSDDSYTAHVRNFAPLYGIDEESATGTSNAALTYYLYHNGIIKAPARCAFLQGEAMQRPSVIATTLSNNDLQCEIMVGGPCCVVAQGTLNL